MGIPGTKCGFINTLCVISQIICCDMLLRFHTPTKQIRSYTECLYPIVSAELCRSQRRHCCEILLWFIDSHRSALGEPPGQNPILCYPGSRSSSKLILTITFATFQGSLYIVLYTLTGQQMFIDKTVPTIRNTDNGIDYTNKIDHVLRFYHN